MTQGMNKLIIALLVFGSSLVHASDAPFYKPLPEGLSVRVKLKSIVLPAHADELTLFGIGSDDLKFKIEYNEKTEFTFYLPKNNQNEPKTYPFSYELAVESSSDLNPYVASNSYKRHARSSKEGRVCLTKNAQPFGGVAYFCVDPIIEANKMIAENKVVKTVVGQSVLKDSVLWDVTKEFPTPMEMTFEVELSNSN